MKTAQEQLKELLEHTPLSLSGIAKAVGAKSKTQVFDWEKGNHVPSSKYAKEINKLWHNKFAGGPPVVKIAVERQRAMMLGAIQRMSDRGIEKLFDTVMAVADAEAVLRDPKAAIKLLQDAGYLPSQLQPSEAAVAAGKNILEDSGEGAGHPRSGTAG